MSKKDVSKAAAALGRQGGKAKSERKAKAVRDNGRLGGRPRVIEVDGREYRLSAANRGEVDWEKSRPQIEEAIRRDSTQRNLDDPRFGCQQVGPFWGRDKILIVRHE
jgi:hypothetical protein